MLKNWDNHHSNCDSGTHQLHRNNNLIILAVVIDDHYFPLNSTKLTKQLKEKTTAIFDVKYLITPNSLIRWSMMHSLKDNTVKQPGFAQISHRIVRIRALRWHALPSTLKRRPRRYKGWRSASQSTRSCEVSNHHGKYFILGYIRMNLHHILYVRLSFAKSQVFSLPNIMCKNHMGKMSEKLKKGVWFFLNISVIRNCLYTSEDADREGWKESQKSTSGHTIG